MFTHENIKQIEVDIIDACSLRCPVCSRNSMETKNNLIGRKKYLPLEHNIEIFDRFKNVTSVSFIGTRSESTLYPHLLEFIDYLKSRNISITISTNGNSRNMEWWAAVGKRLDNRDEIRFAIDGSTQDVYEHYRVGGCLEKVLDNHKSLKHNTNCITTLQYIVFKYNQHDIDNIREMKKIHKFDKLLIGHGSYTLDGRQSASKDQFINSQFVIDDFHPPEEILRKYKLIESAFRSSKNIDITCTAHENNEIFINHLGEYSICCFHNGELLRTNKAAGDMKFVNSEHVNKVVKGKYSFCITNCNKICKSMIQDLTYEK